MGVEWEGREKKRVNTIGTDKRITRGRRLISPEFQGEGGNRKRRDTRVTILRLGAGGEITLTYIRE